MSVFRAIVVLALIMLGQPVVKAIVHKKSKRKALKEGIKTLLLSLSAGGSNMAGVAMATASAGTVSYTHLDVYKRQDPGGPVSG